MKIIAIGTLNALGIIVVFIVFGNMLHSLTGQYFDSLNVSTIIISIFCMLLLVGTTVLESKRFSLPMCSVLVTSICITALTAFGIAVAITWVAAGIG